MNLHRINAASTASIRSLDGVAARFLDTCQARGQITFGLSELQRETGLTRLAARRQLARLRARVTRVTPRRDFFLIVSPEYRALGAPPVEWWLDAFCRYRQQPYYLGLLSAAEMHGSSHQAAQVIQVITDRPMPAIVLGRLRVEFLVKKQVAATPVLEAPNAYAPLLLSTPEATMLDPVAYAHRIGGIARAMETIADLRPKITRKGLVRALRTEQETPNKQRLGFILQTLGWKDMCDVVAVSLTGRRLPVMLQTHTPVNKGVKVADPQWMVVDNVSMAPALR